jgi:hypothetical protein
MQHLAVHDDGKADTLDEYPNLDRLVTVNLQPAHTHQA